MIEEQAFCETKDCLFQTANGQTAFTGECLSADMSGGVDSIRENRSRGGLQKADSRA